MWRCSNFRSDVRYKCLSKMSSWATSSRYRMLFQNNLALVVAQLRCGGRERCCSRNFETFAVHLHVLTSLTHTNLQQKQKPNQCSRHTIQLPLSTCSHGTRTTSHLHPSLKAATNNSWGQTSLCRNRAGGTNHSILKARRNGAQERLEMDTGSPVLCSHWLTKMGGHPQTNAM